MSRRTKIMIGIGVVLLLIAIAIFLYFYFRTTRAIAPEGGTFPTTPNITPPSATEVPTVVGEGGGKAPRLVKLAEGPVAGAVPGKARGELVVRYLETATGNAYEVTVATLEKKRLTITTIPKVEEALWNKAGSSVLARYLKDDGETIESFAATIKPGATGAEGELVGSFLPAHIKQVSASPSGKEFAYLRKEGNRSTLIATNWNGTPKVELWRSPILEWRPFWFRDDTIALLSAPSALAEGLLIFVNRATGKNETVLSGLAGLTALPSPSGNRVVWSASAGSGFETHLLERKTGQSLSLSPETLPEKCVWSKDETALFCGAPRLVSSASYPDAWYQGIVSFSDDFWKFNSKNGLGELLLTPSESIDLILPELNADETHLIFINKKDGSLWALRLAE